MARALAAVADMASWVRMVSTRLAADGVEGVQAGQGILEDGADGLAAQLAHGVGAEIVDALAGEVDFAGGDAAGWFEQADNGCAGEGLAGAGFADDTEDLAGVDVHGERRRWRPRGRRGSGTRRAGRGLRGGGRWRVGRPSAQLGVEGVAQPVAEQVYREDQDGEGQAGNTAIHHSPEAKKFWPALTRVPRLGWVGGMPTPRKLRVASVRTATARPMVAMTRTGPMTLGSTCGP